MLHLFHPASIHFSVAFVTAGACAEIAGLLWRRDDWARFGGTLLLIGLASLVPSMITGYLAANTVAVADEARALLDAHERNGWILLGLLLGAQFWKAWCRGKLGPRQARLYALWITVVLFFTLRAAWLGGQMVYFQGVGVR